MTHRWKLACGLFIILWLSAYRPVNAQTEEFGARIRYTFGQQFTFEIRLPDEHQVESLTIFLTAPATRQYVSIDLSAEFLQSNPVIHSVPIEALGLPPFAEILFEVELHEVGGETIALPEQSLIYNDDRFRWQQVRRGEKEIFWIEGDSEIASIALATIDDALPILQKRIPAELPEPLRVYLYPSQADLRTALRLNGIEWVAGAAIPQLGVILVSVPNPRTAEVELARSLPHELSHLLLYQILGADYETVPAWFDEGLATLAEGESSPNQALVLEGALAAATTLPFASLCQSFPESEGEAALAYAQSASLLRLIEAEYGRGAIRRLIQAFSDGASCETASNGVLGLSLFELEQQWLNRSRPQPPETIFWRENLFWLLLVGGFGVVALLLMSNPATRRRPI